MDVDLTKTDACVSSKGYHTHSHAIINSSSDVADLLIFCKIVFGFKNLHIIYSVRRKY
jgi:DNA primase catalytic subunit